MPNKARLAEKELAFGDELTCTVKMSCDLYRGYINYRTYACLFATLLVDLFAFGTARFLVSSGEVHF